jgi:hypothetical protein
MVAAKKIVLFRLLAGLALFLLAWPAAAQQAQERRIGLVIGNAAYQGAELPTTANDAAQQLQAACFDVSGARRGLAAPGVSRFRGQGAGRRTR